MKIKNFKSTIKWLIQILINFNKFIILKLKFITLNPSIKMMPKVEG